jgi:zinc protease
LYPITLKSSFPADIIKLSNGLTVIHQYIAATPVVVADIWVKAGAIKEPPEWHGIAHFLEHTIFKGTEKLIPGMFDMIIENTGGMTNAVTSHDYAHFFIATAVQHLHYTLPALADLMLNATIPDLEFERERYVVLEEMRQTLDDPDWLGFQCLIESIYQHHPYSKPVLGTEASVMALNPQQMRSFHRHHYQPENMTIVIVGGIGKYQALSLVERYFHKFKPSPDCPIPEIKTEPPLTEIRRKNIYVPRIEQARILMGWKCPGVENLRAAYGLDLLSVLLAEGRTSRLIRELREERQLVQSLYSSFSLQKESSLFTINVCLDGENLQEVEEVILQYLSDLQKYPISPLELQRCQRLLCNDYAFSTETPSQLAGLYGYYNTIANAELSVIYPEQIKSFTVDELQQLANQYLSPDRYAITIMNIS